MMDVFGSQENQSDENWILVRHLVGAVWGKSAKRGNGQTNLLIGHLLDTAAVAELIWDRYLAFGLKQRLDRCAGGQGRRLFVWLCAIHDLGKATPVFQSCDAVEAQRPCAVGLVWNESRFGKKRWRHDRLGAVLLRRMLKQVWDREQLDWVWPLVAGHHGTFPSAGGLPIIAAVSDQLGKGDRWELVQQALLESVACAVGFSTLAEVAPVVRPERADQLTLAGFIVMADWIASDTTFFGGQDSLESISMEASRERAAKAWRGLRLRRGWGTLQVPDPAVDLIKHRFGRRSRGCQSLVVDLAHRIPEPGLLVVEAPMGEGKTKAALAGLEVLAARFGCDGALVAMPTQATCTPVYKQVLEWVAGFDPALVEQVQLLHGKRQFNEKWKAIWRRRATSVAAEDYGAIGEDDFFGTGCGSDHEGSGPATWFLGAKRGLLTAFGVVTIDQLLFAATRSKHVMLRFAGLAGKVVVIDEVHAADVYMSQFLHEVLRLLGQARVPVVLLSATLPPSQRQALCDAYAEGATGRPAPAPVPSEAGYPRVTAVWASGDEVQTRVVQAQPWRTDLEVRVEVLEDTSLEGAVVADRVREELREGGTALVVVNSVERAQRIYDRLKAGFSEASLLLLHGRLDDADRAVRTDQCLDLAKPGPGRDPVAKRVIVATQVAEQSFDVDADLLITDIAPIDLILQRIGRLHRDPTTPRPAALAAPKVLITGLAWTGAEPHFQRTSEYVYGPSLLLRAAASIRHTLQAREPWAVPSQVPALVRDGYAAEFTYPESWQEAGAKAASEWKAQERDRAATAQRFVLTPEADRFAPTLAGLHRHHLDAGHASAHAADEQIQTAVRDGDPTVEVVLVRRDGGGLCAIDGTRLGANGEVPDEALDALLGGTVRLPGKYTEAAERELAGLPGWDRHPWLAHCKALILDEKGAAVLHERQLRYDAEYGLREW